MSSLPQDKKEFLKSFKKLREIDELQAKSDEGVALNTTQTSKLARRQDYLDQCLKYPELYNEYSRSGKDSKDSSMAASLGPETVSDAPRPAVIPQQEATIAEETTDTKPAMGVALLEVESGGVHSPEAHASTSQRPAAIAPRPGGQRDARVPTKGPPANLPAAAQELSKAAPADRGFGDSGSQGSKGKDAKGSDSWGGKGGKAGKGFLAKNWWDQSSAWTGGTVDDRGPSLGYDGGGDFGGGRKGGGDRGAMDKGRGKGKGGKKGADKGAEKGGDRGNSGLIPTMSDMNRRGKGSKKGEPETRATLDDNWRNNMGKPPAPEPRPQNSSNGQKGKGYSQGDDYHGQRMMYMQPQGFVQGYPNGYVQAYPSQMQQAQMCAYPMYANGMTGQGGPSMAGNGMGGPGMAVQQQGQPGPNGQHVPGQPGPMGVSGQPMMQAGSNPRADGTMFQPGADGMGQHGASMKSVTQQGELGTPGPAAPAEPGLQGPAAAPGAPFPSMAGSSAKGKGGAQAMQAQGGGMAGQGVMVPSSGAGMVGADMSGHASGHGGQMALVGPGMTGVAGGVPQGGMAVQPQMMPYGAQVMPMQMVYNNGMSYMMVPPMDSNYMMMTPQGMQVMPEGYMMQYPRQDMMFGGNQGDVSHQQPQQQLQSQPQPPLPPS